MKFLQEITNNNYFITIVTLTWIVSFIVWMYQWRKKTKKSSKYNPKTYKTTLITTLCIGVFMVVSSAFINPQNPQEQTNYQNREKLVDLQFQQTQLQIKMEQHPKQAYQYEKQWKQNQTEINKLTNHPSSYLDY